MRNLNKIPLILFLLFSGNIFAQTYPGYRTGNYTGVNGVFYNPANISDSKYKLDVNIFSIHVFAGNDQASMGVKDLSKSFNADSLKRIVFGGANPNLNSLINTDIYGPSVMFN